MNVRSLLLLCALQWICSGCAVPEQPQTVGARAASDTAATTPPPTKARSSRVALTGSRLPPLDADDPGSHTVGAATGDDYRHDDASRVKILLSQ